MKRVEEDIKDLWRVCFEDTEAFIQFYFSRKFSAENAVTIYAKEQLLSALLMLPYSLNFYGKDLSASYISGACTLPAARGEGLMSRLIREALGKMQERSFSFSMLIPQEDWLYDYYRRSGYVPLFEYSIEELRVNPEREIHRVSHIDEANVAGVIDELYLYFNKEMHKRSFCVQHDEADFEAITEDLYLSNGRLSVYRHPDGAIGGLAFSILSGDRVRIYELLADQRKIKEELIHAVTHLWKNDHIEYKKPSVPSQKLKGGMIRIVNAAEVLQSYAEKHLSFSGIFRVSDDLLPINTGTYLISEGKCTYHEEIEKTEKTMDISDLTRSIIFPSSAYISLMLE